LGSALRISSTKVFASGSSNDFKDSQNAAISARTVVSITLSASSSSEDEDRSCRVNKMPCSAMVTMTFYPDIFVFPEASKNNSSFAVAMIDDDYITRKSCTIVAVFYSGD
jgi:hypothetical protein